MMNQVMMTGKLGADPEILVTKNADTKVTKLSIALNEYRLDEETNNYEKVRTNWIPVTVFGELAQKVGETLKSGDQVTIMGSLRSSSFDKDGEKVTVLGVIARSILKSENLPMTDDHAAEMIKKNLGVSEPKVTMAIKPLTRTRISPPSQAKGAQR